MGKNSKKQAEILAKRCMVATAEAEKPAEEQICSDGDPGIVWLECPYSCGWTTEGGTEEQATRLLEVHISEFHPEPPAESAPIVEVSAPVVETTQTAEPETVPAVSAPVQMPEPEPEPEVTIADLQAAIKAALQELTGVKTSVVAVAAAELSRRNEAEEFFIFIDGLPATIKEVTTLQKEWAEAGLDIDLKALKRSASTVANLYKQATLTPFYALGKSIHLGKATKVAKVEQVQKEVSFKEAVAQEKAAFKAYCVRRDAILAGKIRAESERHPICDIMQWVRHGIAELRKDNPKPTNDEFFIARKRACIEALGWYGIVKVPGGLEDPDYLSVVHRCLEAEANLRQDLKERQAADKDAKPLDDKAALAFLKWSDPNSKGFVTDDTLGRPKGQQGTSSKSYSISKEQQQLLKDFQRGDAPEPNQGQGSTRKTKKGR